MRKTDGFTLIELMVGILCSALVTGAIITFMLMGVKTNHSVLDANSNQRNAKIIVSMVENLANEGSIAGLKINGELQIDASGNPVDIGKRSWYLYDQYNHPLLSYSPYEKTIFGRNNTVLMENVNASMLTMSKSDFGGCLLGFAIQTDDSLYETSVYNRVAEITTEGIVLDENNFQIIDSDRDTDENPDTPTIIEPDDSTNDGRIAFLKVLTSQYGSSGTIISNGMVSQIPYSLWYNGGAYPPGWDQNTPWCAIFLSWAAAQVSDYELVYPLFFAHVDEYWKNETNWYEGQRLYNSHVDDHGDDILPGDLIFFDWEHNNWSQSQYSLDHVGAVFYRDDKYVYTIEGNTGNQVAFRRYDLRDPHIIGYAILPWEEVS